MTRKTAVSPILNSPYEEPERHYATDAQGNLNHQDVREGRRIYTPDVPQVPLGQLDQGNRYDLNDCVAEYEEHHRHSLQAVQGRRRRQCIAAEVDNDAMNLEILHHLAAMADTLWTEDDELLFQPL